LATLDQYIKKTKGDFTIETPMSGYKLVKHTTLIRLALLSYLEGGFGNMPRQFASLEDIYATIARISQDSRLLSSLFGSPKTLKISKNALRKQLKQMVRNREIIPYSDGFRLRTTHADSVFLELETDPF